MMGVWIVRTSRLRCQPVQRVVALAVSANLPAEGERGGRVQGTAVGVDIDNGDLNRGVVLRGNETVYMAQLGLDQECESGINVQGNALVAAHLRGT